MIWGIGLSGLMASIITGFIYYVDGNSLDLTGSFLAFILSMWIINRFTEGKAQRSKNREFIKSGILDGEKHK